MTTDSPLAANRTARQQRIIEILTRESVGSQASLAQRLKADGIQVTQAIRAYGEHVLPRLR